MEERIRWHSAQPQNSDCRPMPTASATVFGSGLVEKAPLLERCIQSREVLLQDRDEVFGLEDGG